MSTGHSSQAELFLAGDPYNYAISAFCGRWKPVLLKAVEYDEATRFNRFTKQLPISDKVLAQNLRELESDGLILRIASGDVPPKVEYRLTERGKTVIPILEVLYDWGWREMHEKGLIIDPLGEMWHGYREKDEELMSSPYSDKGPGR